MIELKDYKRLDDIEIDGVKLTNIYQKESYVYRTSGYNYYTYFHCDIDDKEEMVKILKKAFPYTKNHVEYDGSIGTYAVDHYTINKVEDNDYGVNWEYNAFEGNDD